VKIDQCELAGPVICFDFAEWTKSGGAPMLCYIEKSGSLRIVLGCRHFSIAEAHEHWKDRADRPMTRLALDFAEMWAARMADDGAAK
jgi:hypothetical protein